MTLFDVVNRRLAEIPVPSVTTLKINRELFGVRYVVTYKFHTTDAKSGIHALVRTVRTDGKRTRYTTAICDEKSKIWNRRYRRFVKLLKLYPDGKYWPRPDMPRKKSKPTVS